MKLQKLIDILMGKQTTPSDKTLDQSTISISMRTTDYHEAIKIASECLAVEDENRDLKKINEALYKENQTLENDIVKVCDFLKKGPGWYSKEKIKDMETLIANYQKIGAQK